MRRLLNSKGYFIRINFPYKEIFQLVRHALVFHNAEAFRAAVACDTRLFKEPGGYFTETGAA